MSYNKMVAYEKQTVRVLQDTAVRRKLNKRIVGFWKLNKAGLIDLLRNPPPVPPPVSSTKEIATLCSRMSDCKIAKLQTELVDEFGARKSKK